MLLRISSLEILPLVLLLLYVDKVTSSVVSLSPAAHNSQHGIQGTDGSTLSSSAGLPSSKAFRSLSENVQGDTPDNIFDSLGGGGDDDDDDNSTSVDVGPCVRPDQYGDYGASTPYTDAALVAFTYQIQGRIQMTATTVTQHVIPKLEAALSRRLVETLFGNTTVCENNGNGSPFGVRQRRQRRRRRQLQQHSSITVSRTRQRPGVRGLSSTLPPWTLDNGAQVTGVLAEPRDRIMNGHEGVLCENTVLVSGAVRCFKLIGGLTLTGIQGNIDQAVEAAQTAIANLMNSSPNNNNSTNNLEDVHGSLLHVKYVAEEPDYHVYFGGDGDDQTPQPSDPLDVPKDDDLSGSNSSENDGRDWDWPIWPFLVAGSCLVLCCLGCLYWIQRDRRRSRKGSFGGSIGGGASGGGGRRGRRRQRRQSKHRLLTNDQSSDDSGISDSTDSMEQTYSQHRQPISNTWRVLPGMSGSRSESQDGEEPTLLSDGAVGSGGVGTDDMEKSKNHHHHAEYFDTRPTDETEETSESHSIMTGSFPDANDGNTSLGLGGFSSDPMIGGKSVDSGSYDALDFNRSGYGSSNYSNIESETDGTSEEEDDDGSSSPTSSGSSPPPPRAWRRSVI